MTKLNRLIKSFLIGVGFGSFFLLGVQLSYRQIVEISRSEFLVVILASGLIGLYSYLFHSEKINFLVAEIFHFILTLGTVLSVAYLFYHVNNYQHYLIIFLTFIIIYVLTWLVIILFTNHEIEKVNKKLEKNREKK
ncbi:DUF3021 domain-containing protein [Enterococcus durans]|uniref:DUF3021 domain-containing protein n=4 Tax=Enterococcus TaxID=1350 RepID=A0A5N0YQE0_9ENTE|nr:MULTISPECIES: DUF3021 domain-containing protein [Enterococcus]EMF0486424.1 DUF3021 domain-containing protein [Enterococcus hirae]KAA9176424.1 DUF3021 domain-containing protein [Enterococcus durans]KAA9182384.1 DUF3021 domain-containing protein [Enterococcus durans]KAA9183350.1 DUF3021 domain-containing protein [Enterococcus durans]KAA9187589.1 DUF3021 domain-containing protein [Enterococcus durans]